MEVQITNPFYLRHLEKLRSDFFDTEGYHDEEFYTIHQDYNNGEYYCSPEYLNVMRLKNHDILMLVFVNHYQQLTIETGNHFLNIGNMNFRLC